MGFIFGLLVFITLVFMIVMWRLTFSAYKRSTRKRSAKHARAIAGTLNDNSVAKHNQLILSIEKVFTCIPFLRLSDDKRDEYSLLIANADKKFGNYLIIPEEVFVKTCYFGLGYLICMILLGLISPIFFALALLTPFVAHIPVALLKRSASTEVEEILDQWLEFYQLYYSKYMQNISSLRLIDVCNTYLPLANPSMKKFLMRFSADLELGEESALSELDLRYSEVNKIHEFVTLAKSRLKGEASSFAMLTSEYNKLQDEVEVQRKEELKIRKVKCNRSIGIVLGVIFTAMVAVFFYLVYIAGL